MLPLSVNTPLGSLVCNAPRCNLNTYLVLKQFFKNLKLTIVKAFNSITY